MRHLTILITGAGSGIGAALAEGLAAAGHTIRVTDINGAAAEAVAAKIVAAGGSATGHALDVTDAVAARDLVAAPGVGPIDALLNNAGLQHVSRLEDYPPEKWQLLVNVMLVGAAYVSQAVLPGMRQRGFGRIINIGSIHGMVASPFKSAYVAAKHGLLGLSKTLALETGDVDITVNTICPAYVRTPLVDAQIAAQAQQHGIPEDRVIREIMLRPMPKQAFISVDEVVAAAQYFLSDAARNVTGQALAIDGGWTAQ